MNMDGQDGQDGSAWRRGMNIAKRFSSGFGDAIGLFWQYPG